MLQSPHTRDRLLQQLPQKTRLVIRLGLVLFCLDVSRLNGTVGLLLKPVDGGTSVSLCKDDLTPLGCVSI